MNSPEYDYACELFHTDHPTPEQVWAAAEEIENQRQKWEDEYERSEDF